MTEMRAFSPGRLERLSRPVLRGVLVVTWLLAGCNSDSAAPLVQEASHSLFEHFIIDPQPPGGEECCTDVVAAGDIDGDGFGDVVVGSENAGAAGLVWYAYPTWQRHDVAEGQFTTDGVVVDFDRDGDQDVVVGDTSRGLVWVENLDSGTDWELHVLVPDQYVHDLEVADLDADNDMDVVLTDKKAVRVYLIDDLAVAATTTALEKAGEGLHVVDLDQDDDRDILYSNLWLEQRDGEWSDRPLAPSWVADTRTVAADINGDDRLDVVLAGSEGDAHLAWFELPEDPGEPWTEHVISEQSLNGTHSLGVADVDGDNYLDVVVAEMHTSPNRRVLVYQQRENSWDSTTLALHGSHNMIVADLDNDGDQDLVGKNYAGPARFLEYWENRSADLALAPPELAEPTAGWDYRPITTARPEHDGHKFGLLIADINDDDRPDVLAGGTAYVRSGHSALAEWRAVSVTIEGDILHALPKVANGWRQLLVVDETSLLMLSAESNDGASWVAETLATLPPGRTQGYAATASHIDGSYDFYFTRGTTLQKLGVTEGPAETWDLLQLRDDVEESGIALADLDRDGDTDIVSVEASGRRLMLLETDKGKFSAHSAGASLHWIDRVETADFDGDGRLDIVYTEESRDGRYNNHVRWLKAPANPWSGVWQGSTVVTLRSANSMDVLDFDNDGDSDIVVAEHTDLRPGDTVTDNFTGVFLNSGDASWSLNTVEIGAHSSHIGTRTVDLDGDGDFDIVSVGWEQTCCVHAWMNPSNRAD